MLNLHHITKRFDDVVALLDVSATFRPGSVHGVLGENGAGKTTLMRIAAGLSRPDEGHIEMGGQAIRPASPIEAARAGIAMVHQHFMLVPTLTVIDNCMIGRRDWAQWTSRGAVARRIRELSNGLGLNVDPQARVESLSVGERQRVEIIRALSLTPRVLILDEPTAVLTPDETNQLMRALERLRDDGLAIVFISHKLEEVRRICQEVTILRRGQDVYRGGIDSVTTREMIQHMVGTEIPALPGRARVREDAEAILELADVDAREPNGTRRIADVNLGVRAGEILGIAGVEGNGQNVLAGVTVGTIIPTRGRILLQGRDITGSSVRARADAGLAHIAEDRLHQALVPPMSIEENLALKSIRLPPLSRAGLIRWRSVRERALASITTFDIRGGLAETPVRMLSGGNQQKVVLARELGGSPRVIVAHNPVRGLDVGATQFVFSQLLARRAEGAGILLIHSDLDELLALADRIAVLYDGRCRMTPWPDCTREQIGRLMLGGAA